MRDQVLQGLPKSYRVLRAAFPQLNLPMCVRLPHSAVWSVKVFLDLPVCMFLSGSSREFYDLQEQQRERTLPLNQTMPWKPINSCHSKWAFKRTPNIKFHKTFFFSLFLFQNKNGPFYNYAKGVRCQDGVFVFFFPGSLSFFIVYTVLLSWRRFQTADQRVALGLKWSSNIFSLSVAFRTIQQSLL